MTDTTPPVQLVWFKRDLRLSDHQALTEACKRGPVLCLYAFEPEICQSEDFDGSHFNFICQSLEELRANLRKLGGDIHIRVGSFPDVLNDIHRENPFARIWSHEETGNDLTYQRDRRVADWARQKAIEWIEIPQNGVVRPLKSRDGWARIWQSRMNQPIEKPTDLRFVSTSKPGEIPAASDLGCQDSSKTHVQLGGASHANSTLNSFLETRGVGYRKEMSSPVSGATSCSRMSPYLAWGNISIREVYQRTRKRVEQLRALRTEKAELDSRWFQSLSSFEGRLRWHCHFMQKLEDEPSIEFHNINRAFDGMREQEFRDDYFEAWCRGETGYPMVDACMRCLHATGWINFRMRAMLVSFASHHLWLHWRKTAVYLARHFLDFEPGIHYSQFQMQSAVTGINTVRIYSPAKQVIDQDPTGVFIRKWLPELSGVPNSFLPEPHLMPQVMQIEKGCMIGRDYPAPIVDHKTAYNHARKRIAEIRKLAETKVTSKAVQKKHGSRRRAARARK
jgi:deoxyribodipyrimidine photo-lyase